jgi:hypothetical protein
LHASISYHASKGAGQLYYKQKSGSSSAEQPRSICGIVVGSRIDITVVAV